MDVTKTVYHSPSLPTATDSSPIDATPLQLGESTIFLGGKLRKLVLNFNSLSEVEDRTGRTVANFVTANFKMKDMITIVYELLKEGDPNNPEVTEKNVGSWLYLGNFKDVLSQVFSSMQVWQPSDERYLAPFVPTPEPVVRRMFELANLQPGETVLDLGCGTGETLLLAATDFSAAKLIGYELDDTRHQTATELLQNANLNFVIHKEDANHPTDAAEANVVFLYLLTTSNEKLRPMLEQKLQRGTRVVSHDFKMHEWDKWAIAEDHLTVDGKSHSVYVYRVDKVAA